MKESGSIKYTTGYKYRNEEYYWVETPIKDDTPIARALFGLEHGILKIHEGYAWDGPSGPTIDTPKTIKPSMVHDCFYQMMRDDGLDTEWRDEIDMFFYQQLRENKMFYPRAKLWYWGVRVGAQKSATHPRPIIEAP